MKVLGRWMGPTTSGGMMKSARPSGGSVNGGVVMAGTLIWGRVKPVAAIGSMVNGGVVIAGVVTCGSVNPSRWIGAIGKGGVVISGVQLKSALVAGLPSAPALRIAVTGRQ